MLAGGAERTEVDSRKHACTVHPGCNRERFGERGRGRVNETGMTETMLKALAFHAKSSSEEPGDCRSGEFVGRECRRGSGKCRLTR